VFGTWSHRVNGLFILASVFAYLDPGTGSMLVQLLVGGLAAVAVTAKLYWHRILKLLRIRKDEPEPERKI
jgi:O-antigen/teichoic acid export membrane protein